MFQESLFLTLPMTGNIRWQDILHWSCALVLMYAPAHYYVLVTPCITGKVRWNMHKNSWLIGFTPLGQKCKWPKLADLLDARGMGMWTWANVDHTMSDVRRVRCAIIDFIFTIHRLDNLTCLSKPVPGSFSKSWLCHINLLNLNLYITITYNARVSIFVSGFTL